MKKYLFIIFNIILIFITFNVNALTVTEIESRNVCNNFELATANSDKTLTSISCYETYQEAKNIMNTTNDDDLVILERKNNKTSIIDAKYALVYLNVRSVNENTYYYADSNLKTSISYMNHHINYGATDGVFLEFNYSNHAIKLKSSGVIGWIKENYYKIIPLNFVGTISYYKVTNSELYHYYGKDIQTNYSAFGRVIDKKPSYLKTGDYYSFDGIYFYDNLKKLINDYKNNNYNNSVNKDNPYYNYYMYLPHRGTSNYSADDIDSYLKNNKGLIGTIYGNKLVSRYSNMYQTGIFFKSAEKLYGANAILMMSLATNESALGQSSIAILKNNLFGHAAYDSDAYNSATGYLNPYQSVIGHAKSYINCGYANPKDSRYYGSNMGNKSSGMNIKYASDPYWGEKAANYYYLFDKDNGFLDYNYYQLGITTSYGFNVRSEPNMTSSIPFTINDMNIPVIILDEVEGASYDGSTKWYKIVSDMNLNETRTAGVSCTYTNYYNFNSYVYVHSSFIKKINITFNNKHNNLVTTNYKDYSYKEYSSGANYTPKVGLVTEDTTLYDTATMSVTTGVTIKKGHLATVFMEALENNKVVAYLITSDYTKNQKAWISADKLTITNKDILKVSLVENGSYLNVFNSPNGKVLGSIYTNTYTTIIDKQTVNNDLWLKIYYNVDNSYAWINTNISSSIGTLTYTLDKLNQKPIINVTNKEIYINDEFNPLTDVTANDSEDGDLTNKIVVKSNNVNSKIAGTYQVTYEVTDSNKETTSKTIQVLVKDYQQGNSLFIYESLKYGKDDIFEIKGFLGIKRQDNKNIKHRLGLLNEETKEIIYFELDKYLDYPYEMSSLDDDKKYDYSGGWFQGEINLESIDQGNYILMIYAYNLDTGYMSETYFTNIAYLQMERRIKTSNRGFAFDIDFSYQGSPIIMQVRDNDLLSYDVPTTIDPMYNFFNKLILNDNKLTIMGTSHNYGSSYSKNDNIEREIIFENLTTYKRYSYDLGYIDNGLYQVTLPVSDNLDKTRAWYKKEIDLSNLETGNYSIYIKTTSNNKTYYGELIDVSYTDFTKINNLKYKFKRVDEKRLRLELEVK